jgi:hypothetical protein
MTFTTEAESKYLVTTRGTVKPYSVFVNGKFL